MHFGVFLEERRRGTSEAAAFRETLELAEAAEAWGLDGVWLGEIHFTPARSVQSAPMALASFIAARTRRVRVGTAVQVLPLGNPLRIAEEVATVDHLSEGRFDFGIGRSGSPRAYDSLGIPYAESQGRFQEALEIILEAWKGESFIERVAFLEFLLRGGEERRLARRQAVQHRACAGRPTTKAGVPRKEELSRGSGRYQQNHRDGGHEYLEFRHGRAPTRERAPSRAQRATNF